MNDYLPYYRIAMAQYPELFKNGYEIFGETVLARVWAAECAYIKTFYALPEWGTLVETFYVMAGADGDLFIFVARDVTRDN